MKESGEGYILINLMYLHLALGDDFSAQKCL